MCGREEISCIILQLKNAGRPFSYKMRIKLYFYIWNHGKGATKVGSLQRFFIVKVNRYKRLEVGLPKVSAPRIKNTPLHAPDEGSERERE